MEDISIVHDTSSPHANLKSYLDCKEECAKQKDCLLWTHIGGRCYLKTDNTFTATNSKVTSGKKGCNSSGKWIDKHMAHFRDFQCKSSRAHPVLE